MAKTFKRFVDDYDADLQEERYEQRKKLDQRRSARRVKNAGRYETYDMEANSNYDEENHFRH